MKPCLVAVLVLAACTGDRGPKFKRAGATSPRDGGTLRYSTLNNVRTLDPAIAYDDQSTPVLHPLFDTLLAYGDNLALVPRLAERWTISPDGLVYTFAIRPDVTFSDGTPLSAQDFVYSLERVRGMADSPYNAFLADVGTITAREPLLLEITLTRPAAAFLYVLAMPFTTPLSKKHVESVGDAIRSRPLGTGPFMLARWDEGRTLELRRNPRYWNPGRAHLDAIVLLENVPRDTQFMMFERGELDAAERLSPPDLLWVTAQPEWQPYVHRVTQMNAYGARFNVTQKPFDDRRMRQAFNYALDKTHSVKLLNGSATPSHGMLIPGMLGHDPSLSPYPHDPAKARALLAEAGYPHGFETEYVIVADDEAARIGASLQADLAQVGVRVKIAQLSFATFAGAIGSRTGPAFSYIGWIADYPDPTTFFDGKFHSHAISEENSGNDSFYANTEVDRLLDAGRGEPDLAKRDAIYKQVERLLYDDAPWLWNYHQMQTEVVQPYVMDYRPHPVYLRDFSEVWLDVGDAGPVAR